MTTTEKDLYLYLCRHQTLDGAVTGVYYRAVAAECGMSKASYYNARNGLAGKGFIRYQIIQDDCNVVVVGNDFSDKNFKGYINLNREVFHKRYFKKLNGRETYFVLEMLKNSHRGDAGGYYRQGTKEFYEKYMDILHIKARTLRAYLHVLKAFFSVGIKNGFYYIEYRKKVFDARLDQNNTERKREDQWYIEQIISATLRRKKRKPSGEDMEELTCLYRQYEPGAEDMGCSIREVFIQALEEAIAAAEEKISYAYINKLIKSQIYA